ncbi:alpha/beta hydrolase [Streptomyces coeruleorubidus]|uniref:alpha/beta fold hydrolase n=1 Tax=Streptomyces coeruleorubidus TaxID=116188 RepID=UPI0033D6356A
MTVVSVHGVPETGAIWQGVRDHLDRDSIALDLPGFGAPVPAGLGSGKEAYAAWLADTLRQLPGPIDLVGHDWGALLTYRVATAYDVPLRSWAADVASVVHPSYVWHDLARIWQTPGEGEAFNAAALSTPVDESTSMAGRLRDQGVPPAHARAVQEKLDETMAQSILALYRSALPNPYADWGADFARTDAPGLVLKAADDAADDGEAARHMARVLGAQVRVLDGVGHFWMLQDPQQAAQTLREFWHEVDGHRGTRPA